MKKYPKKIKIFSKNVQPFEKKVVYISRGEIPKLPTQIRGLDGTRVFFQHCCDTGRRASHSPGRSDMSVVDSVKENMRNSLHRTESEENKGKTQLSAFNRIRSG